MLRVVVAVTLAVALLSVTLPALETARASHSDHRIAAEIDGLTAAIDDVRTRESAVEAGTGGTRRVVTVRLPSETWTSVGTEYVAIGGYPDDPALDGNGTTLAWRVAGGQPRERQLPDVTVEPKGHGDSDGPLVLRDPGPHRLAISLIERGNRTVVVVERVTNR